MGEGSHIYGKKAYRTDKGLNEKEKWTISRVEAAIRKDLTNENTYTIDKDGVILWSAKGLPNQVEARGAKDLIITHNHTPAKDTNYEKGIGLSFSEADIMGAVEWNLKEMRVVTPHYTYSLRRKGKSWGNPRVVRRNYEIAYNNAIRQASKYAKERGRGQYANRAASTLDHILMKEFAKNMGWIYTKQKIK